MLSAKLLLVLGAAVVVQLEKGGVVCLQLDEPCGLDPRSVSLLSPIPCHVTLGDYNFVRSRFQGASLVVGGEGASMKRHSRIGYKKIAN